MSDLNDFLKLVSEAKKTDPVAIKAKEQKEYIQEVVKTDLGSLFAELAALKKKPELVEEVVSIVEEIPLPVIPTPEVKAKTIASEVDKYLTTKSFQQPDPDKVDPNIKAIQDKMKFLEQAIGRIAAAGPGGGEVNLRWLDDVKRDTISDGRWLKYSEADKKFVFDEINPHEVVYNTTLVTTATYTVDNDDWYIGVNRAGPVSITLPTSPSSGRVLVIKDESGNASINPITVLGTVDNDAGGFILQMDNGGIQMVYRSGWRVI